ncbi:unnamed protein product, partial [Prorocentrum cordatum]
QFSADSRGWRANRTPRPVGRPRPAHARPGRRFRRTWVPSPPSRRTTTCSSPASAAAASAARPGLPPDHAAAPAPRRAQGRPGASCGAQTPLAELVRHHSLPEVDRGHERRADQEVTTMTIVNLPYSYPQWMLQWDVNEEGLAYDFFHVPHQNRRTRNRGFAFINFLTPEAADIFMWSFTGRELSSPAAESKVVTVVPARLQGFEANASLYPGGVVQNPQLLLQRHHQRHHQQLRQQQQQQQQRTTVSGSGSSRDRHAAVPAAIGHSAGSSSSSSDVPLFLRLSL